MEGKLMKNKLTLLLIEDDPIACKELQDYFETCEDMTLMETTNDANLGLKLVCSHLPNVVLLDLELHHGSGNGFMFLNDLNKLQLTHTPYIIVTTQNMSEVTLEQARLLGADFILTKYDASYSPEYIASTIRIMHGAILRKNTSVAQLVNATPAQVENLVERRIQREMELIGINPKNKGFNYLVDSIYNYMQDPSINLSRALVDKYSKSEKSIERAMQNAINRAWRNTDIDELLTHYKARIRSDKGVPTLTEFIHYYAKTVKGHL